MDVAHCRVFVPLIGQFDNIGDVMLRRVLASGLRDFGQVNVYLGSAPDDFVEGLQLPENCRVYRSLRSWYSDAVTRSDLTPFYIFKPGEVRMAVMGLREQIGVLPLARRVRQQGGKTFIVGVGLRGRSAPARLLARPAVSTADVVAWRSSSSRDYMGLGSCVPDLAFGEKHAGERPLSASSGNIVISLRSDRPRLPRRSLDVVASAARNAGGSVIVVSQVRRDADLAEQLARDNGFELVHWGGQDIPHQEEVLRATYRSADVVISNRLHVLIAAFAEGTEVVEARTSESTKIADHFAVVETSPLSASLGDLLSTDELLAVSGSDGRQRSIDRAHHEVASALKLITSKVRYSS